MNRSRQDNEGAEDVRDEYDVVRDRYLEILSPLFFPTNPFKHDIVRFFAALLRVSGMEGKGWDPYLESRAILEDLNSLLQKKLPKKRFPDGLTGWRLGLILYNQILEMSAPYEVLANLLRFRLEEGYSPNPFFKFLAPQEQKRLKRFGLYPRQKIEIIQKLADRAEVDIAAIFQDFVRFDLRNAIAHADYIISDETFRCRGGSPDKSFTIHLDELNKIITAAKAFASAFFILEFEARKTWGNQVGRAIPYDPHYKGLMEVLADSDGLLTGFKVHWPNREESYYCRESDGIRMVNCFLSANRENIELFVGIYARHRSSFSPLVEHGATPIYTPVQGSSEEVTWDFEAAAATQPPLPEVNLGRKVDPGSSPG